MSTTYNTLIMGASYGSLLAIKLLLAGHSVKLVCLPDEAALINRAGQKVRLPAKDRDGLVEIDSTQLPGALSAAAPASALGLAKCHSQIAAVHVHEENVSVESPRSRQVFVGQPSRCCRLRQDLDRFPSALRGPEHRDVQRIPVDAWTRLDRLQ